MLIDHANGIRINRPKGACCHISGGVAAVVKTRSDLRVCDDLIVKMDIGDGVDFMTGKHNGLIKVSVRRAG